MAHLQAAMVAKAVQPEQLLVRAAQHVIAPVAQTAQDVWEHALEAAQVDVQALVAVVATAHALVTVLDPALAVQQDAQADVQVVLQDVQDVVELV